MCTLSILWHFSSWNYMTFSFLGISPIETTNTHWYSSNHVVVFLTRSESFWIVSAYSRKPNKTHPKTLQTALVLRRHHKENKRKEAWVKWDNMSEIGLVLKGNESQQTHIPFLPLLAFWLLSLSPYQPFCRAICEPRAFWIPYAAFVTGCKNELVLKRIPVGDFPRAVPCTSNVSLLLSLCWIPWNRGSWCHWTVGWGDLGHLSLW